MGDWIIAVDFDGTIVKHEYPLIGEPVPGAIETLKRLQARGVKIILWTMRSDDKLQEAVEYLVGNDIWLYGVNNNPTQHEWTNSRKAYAHVYIDDAALGCPMIYPAEGRPYVDWSKVMDLLPAGIVWRMEEIVEPDGSKL